MTINEWIKDSSDCARDHGWFDNRSFGEHVSLMHAELSEAIEEYRKGRLLSEVYFNGEKPEGIPVELADVLIRIFAYCGQHDIDLNAALEVKSAYNQTRPYRHGNKVI